MHYVYINIYIYNYYNNTTIILTAFVDGRFGKLGIPKTSPNWRGSTNFDRSISS